NLTGADNSAIAALQDRFTSSAFVRGSAFGAAAREQVQLLGVGTPSARPLRADVFCGNQQKAAIAKRPTKDCDIIIFDEPTPGIDVGATDEIYQLLNQLAKAGKSIIMISSELPEVLRMAHRVIVMSEGRVTGELQQQEITQENVMHYATLRPETATTALTEAGQE